MNRHHQAIRGNGIRSGLMLLGRLDFNAGQGSMPSEASTGNVKPEGRTELLRFEVVSLDKPKEDN